MDDYLPYLAAINLTQRCNLNCAHCYMDADQRKTPQPDELTLGDLSTLFTDIATRTTGTIVVLTGGEPLLRSDIGAIVSCAVKTGLRPVIGTNGVLLDESKAKQFRAIGLSGVGISLDSPDPDGHDAFRGTRGSFQKACQAIRLCQAHDLHVQVHFTVARHNYRQLEPMVKLAKKLGASIINFFFLVCVGRGTPLMDLPPDLYEQALNEIVELKNQHQGIMIQARCAPHFKRILYEHNPHDPHTRARGYDGGGCLAATHYCRIDPRGEVTPCPYIELSAGNIRQRPFWDIWQEAPLFADFRNPALQGRCGACEYQTLCGGCRARSLVQLGNLMAEDPNCSYVPHDGPRIPVLDIASPPAEQMIWTPQARERLKRIPVFLRKMVEKKLEERARDEGLSAITVELMQKHKQEREHDLGIKFHSS